VLYPSSRNIKIIQYTDTYSSNSKIAVCKVLHGRRHGRGRLALTVGPVLEAVPQDRLRRLPVALHAGSQPAFHGGNQRIIFISSIAIAADALANHQFGRGQQPIVVVLFQQFQENLDETVELFAFVEATGSRISSSRRLVSFSTTRRVIVHVVVGVRVGGHMQWIGRRNVVVFIAGTAASDGVSAWPNGIG